MPHARQDRLDDEIDPFGGRLDSVSLVDLRRPATPQGKTDKRYLERSWPSRVDRVELRRLLLPELGVRAASMAAHSTLMLRALRRVKDLLFSSCGGVGPLGSIPRSRHWRQVRNDGPWCLPAARPVEAARTSDVVSPDTPALTILYLYPLSFRALCKRLETPRWARQPYPRSAIASTTI